jgi:hypothetical protein
MQTITPKSHRADYEIMLARTKASKRGASPVEIQINVEKLNQAYLTTNDSNTQTQGLNKMKIYQLIEKRINEVKEWNQEAGNKLHEQMHMAQNSDWSREDLNELIKTEEDVSDEFYSQDDIQHAEIRSIQDVIIGFYSI